MATITKTIEYAYETYQTSLPGGSTYDFSGLTVVIPETGYTIQNAFSQVTCYDTVTVAASLTGWQIGASFNGSAFQYPPDSAATNAITITTSSENASYLLHTDHTRAFVSSMTTSATTLSIRTKFNTVSTNGITCKVFITYSFDDSNITRTIKTAKIPIGGMRGYVTGTQVFGEANNIPAFNTIFPEASKQYHDIFFEVFGNDGTNATTDFNLTLTLSGDSSSSRFLMECAQQSGRYYYDIWKYPTLSAATSGSNINTLAASSSLSNTFADLSAILTVTYSYDEQATTRVLNSMQTSIFDWYGYMNGNTTLDAETSFREIIINEPGQILTRQSGFVIYFDTRGGFDLFLREKSQSFLTYQVLVPTVNCGQHSKLHRIDSGFTIPTTRSTFSLNSGLNRIFAQNYVSNISQFPNGASGLMYLNYESGKSTYGSNSHNRNLYYIMTGTGGVNNYFTYNFNANNSISTSYINEMFLKFDVISSYFTQAFDICAKYQQTGTSENYGFSGWTSIARFSLQADIELGIHTHVVPVRDVKKFPGSNNPTSLDATINRQYKNSWSTQSHQSVIAGFSVFNIPSVISGTVSNYSGAGTNIPVKIYDYNNNNYLLSANTTTGGVFSANYYDNQRSVFAFAYENSLKQAASDLGTSNSGTTSFDINLDPGGSSETYYGFC